MFRNFIYQLMFKARYLQITKAIPLQQKKLTVYKNQASNRAEYKARNHNSKIDYHYIVR